ncbi:MAG: substrate-binding domain-containing protein [Spirochaetales bacterium]|nr:substrate-binding domain-containing protein [Spirochaetales bacterium]
MKKLLGIVLVLGLLSAGLLFAAGGAESETMEVTVGFSLWTMEYTFFQAVEKGVRDACKDLGYKYVMLDENSDPTKMVQDINTLVGQKVTGIVVTPVDPGAMGPAVQNARNAGIPVVCADIGKSGPVNALLISNNRQGGAMAMEYIDKLLKQRGVASKKVGVGRVQPQWNYARQRGEGFMEKARELGYTVASELVVNPPTAEGGYDTMQQMMSAVPDIAGVFFASGREAVGAANAIKAAGKNILSAGYNGDPEEIQAIRDGILAATIAQQPYNIGYESVVLLKKIFEGEKYEDAVVPVDVALLTPDTIDAFQAEYEKKMNR